MMGRNMPLPKEMCCKNPVCQSAHGVPLEQETLRDVDRDDFFAAVTVDELEVVSTGSCDGDCGSGRGGEDCTVLEGVFAECVCTGC